MSWRLTVTCTCESDFKTLQKVFAEEAKRVASARNHKELGGGWGDSNGCSAHVDISAPIDQRIADLRHEADELEKRAAAGEA
jgi:hypothetical protein